DLTVRLRRYSRQRRSLSPARRGDPPVPPTGPGDERSSADGSGTRPAWRSQRAYSGRMATPTGKASAAPWVPVQGGLPALREAARSCQGCDLYARATQTVFGEGPTSPELVLVGGQPGDREDREGHPFVGPAGQLLDQALEAAGIDRSRAYVTNVVKHFKWERGSGKRRIHSKPNEVEIQACRPWLEAELERIKPRVLVCLRATAAQALL